MKFETTKLAGLFVIDIERRVDERGWFGRTWCADEFANAGLDPCVAQCSSSFNERRGTLRGMHYQASPYEEAKVVRCLRGVILDVAVDLRTGSPTWGQWHAEELSEDSGRALYIPKGFAHGFQTLVDDTEVFYMISRCYEPGSVRGVRFDDPAFGILWPINETIVADKDRNWALV
jgi:dTDP-4-dehydrorhamnose 3,5-epimerase